MMQRSRFYSYGYLLMAADRALARAEQSEGDEFLGALEAMLHSALALEAFLNHLCAQVVPDWPKTKRGLSPRKKLEALATRGAFSISWQQSPFVSFAEVFAFRNLIAHAGTEVAEAEAHGLRPEAKWQPYCKVVVARQVLRDTKLLVALLPKQLGVESVPDFLLAEAVA